MLFTRRQLLAMSGTATLPLITGCASLSQASISTPSGKQSDVSVRLRGPNTDHTLFDQNGEKRVGEIQKQASGFALPVALTDETASHISDVFGSNDVDTSPEEFTIVIRVSDQVTAEFGVSSRLATNIVTGEWEGTMVLMFKERSNVQAIQEALTE